MLILDDEHAHQMRTAGMEVKARGADVIIITDKPAVRIILLFLVSFSNRLKSCAWSCSVLCMLSAFVSL